MWEPSANHVVHLPVHPTLPIIISVQWGASAIIHCQADPSLSPLKIRTADSALAASPPPTPARNVIVGCEGMDGDANALAIAVARVKADKANGAIEMKGVKFRLRYRCEEGESLYLLGSIAELGGWNKMHSPVMKRVDGGEGGQFYEAVMLLPKDEAHEEFEYKYFTRRADGSRRWEEGGNRIARPFAKNAPREGVEGVVLWNDRWERVRFEFSIYYPAAETKVMHVTGDPIEIGAWYKPGPTRMELGPMELLETEVKGRKWYLNVWMERGQPSFSYRYILIDKETKLELWEREPNRRAEFDEEDVVNGVRFLKDVNFVSGLHFDEVPPDMFIGPYPQVPGDVDKMAEGGVTGVFNVQTDEDFKHRGIQWGVLMERYNKHGIKVVRYPIQDFDRDSLRENLHGATRALEGLLREGRKVYVHCTAGMGRAPACVVAYLCWVKKMDLEEAVAHVKRYRTVAVPNVPVISEGLKEPY